jgi:ribosomal protein S3
MEYNLQNEEKEGDVQEVRVLIDNNQVGGIIGKAGANVKRVREEAGVFLSILKAEFRAVQERIMVMKGTISQIAKALFLISELLIEGSGKDKGSGEGIAIRLLVHRASVGAVIGKGGTTIKETQSETNVRVQVSNEPLPNSTEKTVTITGSPSAIQQATTRILTQLKENPLRSGTKVYAYVPGQPMYPTQPAYGLPYMQQQPLGLLQQPFPSAYGGMGAQSQTNMPTSTQKIAIPTVCAGCVIGKGGSVIRDLRAQSQCNISIADPEQNSPNERVVTLTGTSQGIQTAIYLIRQLVEQYQPQQSY